MQHALGKYIVVDPKICHGKITFKGTRIIVADVLDMVAKGNAWEYIIEQYHGNISKAAISEAVSLSKESLLKTIKAA
ncbi:MAG: DUF433 domain-containing protein [Bacteroidota bacterium]